MSEATAVARAASEVESLFCKGRGAEKFNVESSLQIELSFEGSHMLPFGLAVLSPHQLLPPPPNPRPSRVPLLFDLGGRTLYFLPRYIFPSVSIRKTLCT